MVDNPHRTGQSGSIVTGGSGGDLPLEDGSQAAPSLSFLSDLSLGMYYRGATLAGWAVGNETFLDMGNDTAVNGDPVSPAVVRYALRGYQLALNGVNETAFLYGVIDPGAANRQPSLIYADITGNQIDTDGPAIKVIHLGHGDALYVAGFSDGSGYESATFANYYRNFIATQQGDYPNSVHYTSLWEQPSVPGYGQFFAAKSSGKAFVAQIKTGYAAGGIPMFTILSEDLTKEYWGAYTDGTVIQTSEPADAVTHPYDSPERIIRGSYYNGATKEARITEKVVVTDEATDTFVHRWYSYYTGGPSRLLGQWYSDGTLDLQNHSLVNVGGIQANPNLPIYAAGQIALELSLSAVADDSVGILTIYQGGAYVQKRVVQGPADSAGAGYRYLRVAN